MAPCVRACVRACVRVCGTGGGGVRHIFQIRFYGGLASTQISHYYHTGLYCLRWPRNDVTRLMRIFGSPGDLHFVSTGW